MNTITHSDERLHNTDILFQNKGNEHVKKLLVLGSYSREIGVNLSEIGYELIGLQSFSDVLLIQNSILPETHQPHVILIDYAWLFSDKKELVYQVINYANASHIPIFGIAASFDVSEKKEALKAGFSDIYTIQDEVQRIEERIVFLHKFKPKKNKLKVSNTPVFQYNLPLHKRIFDIAFALTALFVLGPLLLIIAILIKLESPGPVLYVSKRVGSGFKIFNFYKFRTMKVGADRELKELMSFNQYTNGTMSSFVKINNDPRITFIGRFLRKTSLDEFPQLYNVLRGNMSVVGNRPLPLYEAEHLTDDVCAKRFLAPAGITGLWQVTKSNRTNISELERKYLDVTYADRKGSWWYDLKIILKTFPALIQKDNL